MVGAMDRTRLEALSDGVFAVAITLLVLDLRVPQGAPAGGLGRALNDRWPNYAGYLVSFFIIGIIWVNHHGMLGHVRRVDRTLLFLNLLLLLFVAVIPFPTALLAEYVRSGGFNSHLAAAVFSGVMFGMSVSFALNWLWILRDDRLLAEDVDLAAARSTVPRFALFGLASYLALIGLSFVSAPLTLALHFLLAVFYIFNQLAGARIAPERPVDP
jgi:uncharacterized membrane protein